MAAIQRRSGRLEIRSAAASAVSGSEIIRPVPSIRIEERPRWQRPERRRGGRAPRSSRLRQSRRRCGRSPRPARPRPTAKAPSVRPRSRTAPAGWYVHALERRPAGLFVQNVLQRPLDEIRESGSAGLQRAPQGGVSEKVGAYPRVLRPQKGGGKTKTTRGELRASPATTPGSFCLQSATAARIGGGKRGPKPGLRVGAMARRRPSFGRCSSTCIAGVRPRPRFRLHPRDHPARRRLRGAGQAAGAERPVGRRGGRPGTR